MFKLSFLQIGETVTVIRKITNNLKTIEWNDRRVKVKTFYNLIHQDYEPDGEPIRRPYIITGEDVSFLFFFILFAFWALFWLRSDSKLATVLP